MLINVRKLSSSHNYAVTDFSDLSLKNYFECVCFYRIFPTVICLCIAKVACFPSFQANIPNGNNVDLPCQPNAKWQGVGHLKKEGRGPRNPFGLDFAANEWVIYFDDGFV